MLTADSGESAACSVLAKEIAESTNVQHWFLMMPVMHRVVSIDDTNYVYIRPAIQDDHTTHDHTTFIHATIYDLLVLLTWPTLPLYDDTTYAIQPTTSRSCTDQIYSHVFHPLHLTQPRTSPFVHPFTHPLENPLCAHYTHPPHNRGLLYLNTHRTQNTEHYHKKTLAHHDQPDAGCVVYATPGRLLDQRPFSPRF